MEQVVPRSQATNEVLVGGTRFATLGSDDNGEDVVDVLRGEIEISTQPKGTTIGVAKFGGCKGGLKVKRIDGRHNVKHISGVGNTTYLASNPERKSKKKIGLVEAINGAEVVHLVESNGVKVVEHVMRRGKGWPCSSIDFGAWF
ncbi:hypothetical protein V6N12_062161 [Hibiscus sabdariffa]|uniref:Uncharacterized protein n=1 Tax=Hibiscus sabdariffa TaxID=183260 RepID=A0ABR2F849_9ROSI